jgi:TorA maturation chaperone TorD
MIEPEEAARANLYALLARLFYAPPDAAMLAAIAAERFDAEGAALANAWRELARAAAHADAGAVREEYENTFIGTGKAPVTLYTSAYAIKYSNEAPLAELRSELTSLGLARRPGVSEPEDHVAALCESMRHLIAEQQRDVLEQKRFFDRWLGTAADALCNAIENHPGTAFYRLVAGFAKQFFALEQSAFEML